MASYIRKRLISFIIVLFGVVTLSFCLQLYTGTDPAADLRERNLFYHAKSHDSVQSVDPNRETVGKDIPPSS